MPIVGFNFDKIIAEKTKSMVNRPVQVKNDLGILKVEKQEIPLTKTEEGIKFDFEFKAEYEPEVGHIILKGHVLFMGKPAEIKKILSNWKKNKNIEEGLMQVLLNTILVKSNIKALMFANEVNLPPHLKLPLIRPKSLVEEQKSKVDEYVG